MASRTATLADFLTDWLNDPARGWPTVGEPWTAERVWEPTLEITDADVLNVQVSPDQRQTAELLTRELRTREYVVFIDVRQRYTAAGQVPEAWIDDRVALVEEIDDQLQDLEVNDEENHIEVSVPQTLIDPVCAVGDLIVLRQYTATIAVTLREVTPR